MVKSTVNTTLLESPVAIIECWHCTSLQITGRCHTCRITVKLNVYKLTIIDRRWRGLWCYDSKTRRLSSERPLLETAYNISGRQGGCPVLFEMALQPLYHSRQLSSKTPLCKMLFK